jgi:hypothetical protein
MSEFRSVIALHFLLSGLRFKIERTIRSGMGLCRGSPAIIAHSDPTSESLLPHPQSVLPAKHSRLAFRTFPLPMKGFSSLSGYPGKARKVPCLPQSYFAPNPLISSRVLIYWKVSSVPEVILPSHSEKLFESRERHYCGNFRRRCSRSRDMCRLYHPRFP